MPNNMFRPTIILREESPTSQSLKEQGIVLGCLLIIPPSLRDQENWQMVENKNPSVKRLHPQFSPGETEYLMALTLRNIRRLVEQRLHELETHSLLNENTRKEIKREVGGIKEILVLYRSEEAASEVDKISDLVDIIVSRLMEMNRVHVVEVIQIEG